MQPAAPNEKVSVWLRWLQTILGLPRVSAWPEVFSIRTGWSATWINFARNNGRDLLCSGYGQSLSTSVARESRHRPRQAHVAAAQRRRLRQPVRRPSAVRWYASASTRASLPQGVQDFERVPWNSLRVVSRWNRHSIGRWSSHLEQTSRVYLRAFWNTHTVDYPRHRSRERLPSERAKWNVVFGRGPHQPRIESHPVPISHRARLRRHVLRRARKHNRAGRDRWHGRCWPNSGVHWDDAEPHTAKDLDLPTVPAGAFSGGPAARTATSARRVEAGTGGLGRVVQEVLGWEAMSWVWGDETQRCIYQSTMETGNLPCLQRMHSAEAWGRHTISVHAVRPMARCLSLCQQASKPAVEHVPRLSVVWCKKAMFFMPNKADKRIFHRVSMESKQTREEGLPALSEKRKMELWILPPKIASATIFPVQQNAPRRRPKWQTDVRCVPCRCRASYCP